MFLLIFSGEMSYFTGSFSLFADISMPAPIVVHRGLIYIELIQGGRLNKSELKDIKNYLRPFTRIHLSQRISITSVVLIEQYGASHGLMLADALIASTALVWGLPLVTLNVKDFEFINGLQLVSPETPV